MNSMNAAEIIFFKGVCLEIVHALFFHNFSRVPPTYIPYQARLTHTKTVAGATRSLWAPGDEALGFKTRPRRRLKHYSNAQSGWLGFVALRHPPHKPGLPLFHPEDCWGR